MTDGIDMLGPAGALEKAADTTQLGERERGFSPRGAIEPPYDPALLAAMLELNGTHAVSVEKRAKREAGYGFELVPHERADDPSESEHDIVDDFWFGRESIWKIGPSGSPPASATEVFENARRDWHAIGWLAIEVLFANFDDVPQGLAHVPAKSIRIRRSQEEPGKPGRGYVQEKNAGAVYFANAGDRFPTDHTEHDEPMYVDKDTGDVGTQDEIDNPANEIIFIPNPHPNSLNYGLPSWIPETETMVGDQEAKRFNRRFFHYDAMAQYAVIVENGRMTDESRQAVTDMIKNLRSEDGRRVVVLEADELIEEGYNVDQDTRIRLEPLTQQGDEDMSFGEYRRANEHDIAKVHSVPPIEIGVTESANRSNSREQVRSFINEEIQPTQRKFEGRIFRVIHQLMFDVHDWTIRFDVRGGESERDDAEIASITVDSVGDAMTVREVRELHGLEGQPDWMADEFANSLFSEVTAEQTPGLALDEALNGAREQAEAEARTEARIATGQALGD